MNILQNPLFKFIQQLPLGNTEFVVMGSGVMFALGIRPLVELKDVDLLVSESGWEKVKDLSENHIAPDWGCPYLYLQNKQIEIYSQWGPPKVFDTQKFINNAIVIQGFRFCNLEDTIKWKSYMAREKDIKHIKLIEDYLKSH